MSTLGLWLLSAGLATLSASAAGTIRSHVTARGRASRLARRLPRTAIAEAASGELVKIVGRLEVEAAPLTAPFSGRACAHYEAGVDVGHKAGFRRRVEEARSTSFVISDGSGRALVETDRLLVEVVLDHLWSSSELDAETRFDLERFLFQAGRKGRRLLADPSRLRYVEGALEHGEVVTVVGLATWGRRAAPGVGYRDTSPTLTIEPPTRGAVFVSDGAHYAA